MLSDASVVEWVDVLPGGGFSVSVEGFLLLGAITVHNDGQSIRLFGVLNRLSRLALSRGADSSLVRRFNQVCKAKRLPNKARLMAILVGLAAFLTAGDVLAEIDRAL